MARTTEKLEEVKESCEKLGSPEVTILEADMLKEDDLAKISQAVSPPAEKISITSSHALDAHCQHPVLPIRCL